ncbi:hypothetical protein LCGC14_2304290 [marine sediment metagenome]|uniref:Uncharacterized protein n=1 Tax=marine sediment metagenome TaxID=412755 RepID=A0A0F9CMI8_9ZZZZ
MMNDLVERLAEKWMAWCPEDEDSPQDEALWWLNAIADELENAGDDLTVFSRLETPDWLRAQANDPTSPNEPSVDYPDRTEGE